MHKKKSIHEVEIHDYSVNGDGVSRSLEIPLFIGQSAVGDRLQVEVYDLRKSFGLAKITKILDPSPDRDIPFCEYFGECGGCQWQHLSYSEQLKAKKNILVNSLKFIGGIDNIYVNEVIANKKLINYRNKSQFVVKLNNNKINIGFFKLKSHELVDLTHCPVAPDLVNSLLADLKMYLSQFNVSIYNESTHHGLLRHIISQYSFYENKILLTLVANAKNINDIEKKQLGNLYALTEKITQKNTYVIGICLNFNHAKTNKILGSSEKNLFGKDYITEKLVSSQTKWSNGKNYLLLEFRSGSFFQINPYICQELNDEIYKLAKSYQVKDNELNIIDAYAGIGTISMWLSGLAKKIISLEIAKAACECGLKNLQLNNINNVSFINGLVEDNLPRLIKNDNFDLIILDPPRKGLDENIIQAVKKLKIKHIIYVSCNPATLARDLKLFLLADNKANNFYKIDKIQPLDMFSHTNHVETIVGLTCE